MRARAISNPQEREAPARPAGVTPRDGSPDRAHHTRRATDEHVALGEAGNATSSPEVLGVIAACGRVRRGGRRRRPSTRARTVAELVGEDRLVGVDDAVEDRGLEQLVEQRADRHADAPCNEDGLVGTGGVAQRRRRPPLPPRTRLELPACCSCSHRPPSPSCGRDLPSGASDKENGAPPTTCLVEKAPEEELTGSRVDGPGGAW